jgi:RNA recognition motif-containing protein
MNIYVGNLSLEATEEELRQAFVVFGQVVSVSIMNDRYIGSGQSRGYGFVEMPSKFQGQAAIVGLNGKMLKDRVIDVVEALPLSNTTGNNPCDNKRGRRSSSKVRQRRD